MTEENNNPKNTEESSDEKDYLITYDREACIGAGSCVAVDPDSWVLVDDGKADLLGGEETKESGIWTKNFSEKDYGVNMDAAESCPVLAIHIKRLKDGKELI